ncbi:MAG TPA: hypothetical protein VIA45_07250 [Thermoanaerobaculia bacterium]
MGVEEVAGRSVEPAKLRRFLHDVSAPLSAVALNLETASRRAAKGEDPSPVLEVAQRELARCFELFERGRGELLGDREAEARGNQR